MWAVLLNFQVHCCEKESLSFLLAASKIYILCHRQQPAHYLNRIISTDSYQKLQNLVTHEKKIFLWQKKIKAHYPFQTNMFKQVCHLCSSKWHLRKQQHQRPSRVDSQCLYLLRTMALIMVLLWILFHFCLFYQGVLLFQLSVSLIS